MKIVNKEIRSRITIGKTTFNKEKRLLTGKLDLKLKKLIVKSFIKSVVLWCRNKDLENKRLETITKL